MTPPPPDHEREPEPSAGGGTEPADSLKKAWQKPRIGVIWDGLLRVESGPTVQMANEGPTYTPITS